MPRASSSNAIRGAILIASVLISFSFTIPARAAEAISGFQQTGKSVSINGIFLGDSESVKRVFGPKTRLTERNGSLGIYTNKSKDEVLTLTVHPGSAENEVSEIDVARAVSEKNPSTSLTMETFKTESGVRLRMTESQVREFAGEPDSQEEKDGLTILHYRLTGESDFLRHYNMPEYIQDFYFEAGKLVRFHFGFPYP